MCACSPLNPDNSRQPTEWEGDANGTFLELRPEEPDSDAVKENGLFMYNHLCIKSFMYENAVSLPRQARDKHIIRESALEKETVFSCRRWPRA